MAKKRKCRFCGCTEDKACKGGCCWITSDVCSSCEGRLIAEALDKFFKDNPKLITEIASGEYLRNRLRTAFIKGWDAARELSLINVALDVSRPDAKTEHAIYCRCILPHNPKINDLKEILADIKSFKPPILLKHALKLYIKKRKRNFKKHGSSNEPRQG